MGAAGAEIAEHAPLRRAHDAVGFGGDQRLVVDLQQNGRFDDLRLVQRRDPVTTGVLGYITVPSRSA